jgi:excisionase family DNA binding protein
MGSGILTTAEAAELLGVGPTALKRWADDGLLRCVRTAGGHRRFLREDLEAFQRERTSLGSAGDAAARARGGAGDAERPHPRGLAPGVVDAAFPSHEAWLRAELGATDHVDSWLDALLRGAPVTTIAAMLLRLRVRAGAWHTACRFLGDVLVGLGDRWASGACSVMEEHLASERLQRAIARVTEEIPVRLDAPRALLATATGEEHTLGLSLVELCLREAGWITRWAGRATPTDEVVALVRAAKVELVALSASQFAVDGVALAKVVAEIEPVCAAHGAAFLLGGRGAWPRQSRHALHIATFEQLHAIAVQEGERHR